MIRPDMVVLLHPSGRRWAPTSKSARRAEAAAAQRGVRAEPWLRTSCESAAVTTCCDDWFVWRAIRMTSRRDPRRVGPARRWDLLAGRWLLSAALCGFVDQRGRQARRRLSGDVTRSQR